jgi:hypothetical protein
MARRSLASGAKKRWRFRGLKLGLGGVDFSRLGVPDAAKRRAPQFLRDSIRGERASPEDPSGHNAATISGSGRSMVTLAHAARVA